MQPQRLESLRPAHDRLPGAKWVHYEISPDMADDPDLVDAAFTDILDRIVKALEGLK